MTKNPKTCALKAASILRDKKGEDILIMDISSVAVFSDYFVVATGTSPVHVRALADEVEKKLGEAGYTVRGKEGYQEGAWVLMDYHDVIVHIFTRQEREYYTLERLWADAKIIDLPPDEIDTPKELKYNIENLI